MTNYKWAVIGAGPSGIAAVGKLLDHGIQAQELLWLDPEFSVGDFGTLWRHVPSNTKVKLFTDFLNASPAFEFASCTKKFALTSAPPNETCELSLMGAPLQWVTDRLLEKVKHQRTQVTHLQHQNNRWRMTSKEKHWIADNVVLAIGAEPKTVISAIPIIPLQDAMDQVRIANHIQHDVTVAVFGSSHSAMLVLKNLVEYGVKRIINFYRSPLRYAVYYDTWILFDDTGLKGTTAVWAHENIDGTMPTNLERVESTEENVTAYLTQCDKAIYATGFERRKLPLVDNLQHLSYEEHTGIIGPGLFGIGIAFPEARINPMGLLEYRVGLWKFMEYLNRVTPVWLSYSEKT